MCDLWKTGSDSEVEPSFYYHLPKSLRNVNITGGEPFLRKDLDKIVMVMTERCRKVRPVISTNGFLPDRIKTTASSLYKINSRLAVRVSIDGAGKTHDKIRGVAGGYEKAMASLHYLKESGIKDIGIGFTLIRENQEEMMDVYRLSKKMGIQFTATVAHSSPIFFGDQNNQAPDEKIAVKGFSELMSRQLSSLSPKNWFRAYFTNGVIDQVKGRKRRVLCPALTEFFFLNPKGDVFPCHLLDEPVGNLMSGSYQELTANVKGGPDKYQNCSMECWMTCTVAPRMRKNPIKALRWIIKSKLVKPNNMDEL